MEEAARWGPLADLFAALEGPAGRSASPSGGAVAPRPNGLAFLLRFELTLPTECAFRLADIIAKSKRRS